MICKNCPNFIKIANTDETGQGICGYPMSYVPVGAENECVYAPKPYTCGDCSHFIEGDAACMTCQAEDSAYYRGELCGGFVDKYEDSVYEAFADWTMRGYDIMAKLTEVCREFDEEFSLPWQKRE